MDASEDHRPEDRRGGAGHQDGDGVERVEAAKTETGLVVGVPNFINEGDVITVDTETGEYVGRAKSA